MCPPMRLLSPMRLPSMWSLRDCFVEWAHSPVQDYVPPPLVIPRGGGVTWSTQNFLLRLIVLLCG